MKCIEIAIISLIAFSAPLNADVAPKTPKAQVDLPEKLPSPQAKKKATVQDENASKTVQTPVKRSEQSSEDHADSQDTSDDQMPSLEGAPMKVPDNGYSKQFAGTLIAVLILTLLVFVVIWLMRRFSTNRPLHMNHRKHIKVIERRPLSQSTYVYLVQVGDKQFVVAESKFNVTNVATLDWNEQDPDR